ncbi:MAG: class I SAM-dependent methyltransferase [Candidatus Nomurabacteria bacterium]|jgi:SAM-dependent methyltransferase|nr:class I SAM-dependent methyltransferase [Candidatus Nomurabacteria bacterium]
MKDKYPKHEIYEELYKRYFKRDVQELIDLAEVSKNDKVLDICGGNGRLTKKLAEITRDVSYLDQEPDMTPKDLADLGVTVYNTPVQDFIEKTKLKYDKVFCQQAVNYWLLDIDIELFSEIFAKGGLFIFNTFANKPTEKPMFKQYEIDGVSYLEISYLVDNKVHHVQIREGYEPHYTVFDWIDEDTVRNLLEPYFNIEIVRDGSTLIYKCRKR